MLGYYLQIGCESVTDDPQLPSAESFAVLLEAFVSALALRTVGENPALNDFCLENLSPGRKVSDIAATSQTVVRAARQHIRRLKNSPSTARKAAVLIGRNLYALFRDERLKSVEALNETLRPYLTVLFRVAARAHYIREGRPILEAHGPPRSDEPVTTSLSANVTRGYQALDFVVRE